MSPHAHLLQSQAHSFALCLATAALDHVTLMAPHLAKMQCEVSGGSMRRIATTLPHKRPTCVVASAQVEVPMNFGSTHSYDGVPVHAWTASQVIEWLATAHNGRFAYVAVPPGIEGFALLQMNARRLTELVEEGERAGR